MSKYIMVMGTSSHVGKSILCAALCRIFFQEGRKVAPFKAQNMALNSFVTKTGGEMGRAQVVQAEAAGIEPDVAMNPVLLKPTGNSCSQVVLMGKVLGNMSAKEYHQGYSVKAFQTVKEALAMLEEKNDTLVIEGAGSPAEVNLKDGDIVNMRVAKYLHAPVILVADIDRGGALAALVGTLELLDEDERALVKGLVINKFRGDITLLAPAIDFLEQRTGKPVLGVIPHIESLGIDDEDSVSLERRDKGEAGAFLNERSDKKLDLIEKLDITVVQTPHIANFTDFTALAEEPDVILRYVDKVCEMKRPDVIILPGSKNTMQDLIFLREHGLADKIIELRRDNVPVIGICGGYQMLGESIDDPKHTESKADKMPGLGLLPLHTVLAPPKITAQVVAACPGFTFVGSTIEAKDLRGYEIHMGRSVLQGSSPFIITERQCKNYRVPEGLLSEDGMVLGTYIHGLFDHDDFRRKLINALRRRKRLADLPSTVNRRARQEQSYNRLAQIVRENMNMDKLRQIMEDTP